MAENKAMAIAADLKAKIASGKYGAGNPLPSVRALMRLHGVARSTANRVMLIDKDYSHALVGSGSADYLWILSRTPCLPETAKSELLAEARRRGYVTDKLIWVKQK